MTLVLATFNHDKLKDLLSYFTPHFSKILPLSHWTQVDIEETGQTFEENALIKAQYSFDITQHPSIADDSGFCMRSLDGLPGIYAGRFAKTPTGKTDFKYAFEKLEDALGEKDPITDFVCSLSYIDHHHTIVVHGVVEGFFDFSKKNNPGFGYTPIFVPLENNPSQLSLSEMGDDVRRTYSACKYAVNKLLSHFP